VIAYRKVKPYKIKCQEQSIAIFKNKNDKDNSIEGCNNMFWKQIYC
jgi:hypothetical protein